MPIYVGSDTIGTRDDIHADIKTTKRTNNTLTTVLQNGKPRLILTLYSRYPHFSWMRFFKIVLVVRVGMLCR